MNGRSLTYRRGAMDGELCDVVNGLVRGREKGKGSVAGEESGGSKIVGARRRRTTRTASCRAETRRDAPRGGRTYGRRRENGRDDNLDSFRLLFLGSPLLARSDGSQKGESSNEGSW